VNPLKKLNTHGQSVWLDYIRRNLITSGELERLVKEDGLRGVTSNPTIFQKAIAGSSDYDDKLRELIDADPHADARSLFEKLAIEDIQLAADILKGVYDETDGADGFVCIELPPELSHNTKQSIEEAHRIWKEINRPNIMIKVPATPEGIPVIETLISAGINVNITLMFSLSHYEAVVRSYLKGLGKCSEPHKVASVASFFVSRVDNVVDQALDDTGAPEALDLRGKIAVANAKMAYKRFKEVFSGDKWKELEKKGARVQRPLWASTGTKNPTYSDVLYIEELIGPDTVNTMPPATMNAFRDHGTVRPSLEEGWEEAEKALERLTELGIDLAAITEKLQEDGVKSFEESFDSLLSTLQEKRHAMLHDVKDYQSLELGNKKKQVDARLKLWKEQGFSRRLWSKDPTLWFPEPQPEITDRLGWLVLPEMMHDNLEMLDAFAEEIKDEGISDVVLFGMGGSSLAPDVFQKAFGNAPGYPRLSVLDSTHPGAVRSLEDGLDLSQALFLVSSKSGTTLETLSLFRYFWNKVSQVVEDPGKHFVAITDSGTPLHQLAQNRSFRRIFEANPDVGGRYSAFTYFGMVPAVLIGMDVHALLDRAWTASENCASCVSEDKAAGLRLGASLGEIAKDRNKLTFFASESIQSFPDWLEQLVAESTGKDGKGILPVAGETFVSPSEYGQDRFFVFLSLEGGDDQELQNRMNALKQAGHPCVWIELKDHYDLGREIYSWEIAVASAGSVLGIHPFNQPDVRLAKDFTKTAMEESEKKEEESDAETWSTDEPEALAKALKDWLGKAKTGDYFALQAYLPVSQSTTDALQDIRLELLKRTRSATTLGYGPRFLHSTGQLHKGGQNTGLFLQIIDEPDVDLPVPETEYSFKKLIKAQSLGDYRALKQRGRRVIRVNLGVDIASGMRMLHKSFGRQD
jgi:transaldolase/glucose-6-phosphate isomerase